jgi:hypothetical protein
LVGFFDWADLRDALDFPVKCARWRNGRYRCSKVSSSIQAPFENKQRNFGVDIFVVGGCLCDIGVSVTKFPYITLREVLSFVQSFTRVFDVLTALK